MQKKILLIDGHSILNRAYYGVPPLTNSKGEPTGAVYGFMNIMFKITDKEQPTHIAVAFDRHEPTFRHEMFPQYKGTRKPMPDDLHKQVPVIKELLKACGITVIEKPGYEADDIIGTLSVKASENDFETIILSGDRDLLQLVAPHVTQFIPKTKSGVTTTEIYTPDDVKSTYGVTPSEFIDVKALQGDTSDNIPGVPGVGEKTAQALIAEFHSIDGVKEHIDEVKPARAQNAIREHFDMAVLSKTLATICLEAPVDIDFNNMVFGNIYTNAAYEMLSHMELKTLMKRFSDGGLTGDTPSVSKEDVTLPAPKLIQYIGMDTQEVDAVFEKAMGKKTAIKYANYFGNERLVLTYDGADVYDMAFGFFINADYLSEKLNELVKSGGLVIAYDLAEILRVFDVTEADNIYDCKIAAYLLNPLGSTYEYEDIARDFLNLTYPSKTEILDKKAGESASGFADFLARQVQVPYYAWEAMESALKSAGMHELYTTVEMPTAFRLHELEVAGIRVNKEELSGLAKTLGDEISRLENEIYELAGCKFNINSPKQLGEVLFDKMKLPGAKKTKSGYSTAADVLEKLKADNPVIEKILEYRTYAKLSSTYALGLAPFIQSDGRIHGHFLQTVTATGRISSADPNLQNIPVREEIGREIRKVFIPADGCVFVDADYSQIELRVLAHMSGDERLINAYKSSEDIHRITASEVFHVPLDDVTKFQRSAAKAVNFGIVYGESAFGLAEGLGISRKEANDYINDYFKTYPGVKAFLDGLVAAAKNNGYSKTVFGRRRPIPELKSGNFMVRQFGERVAMNSPIQGTAADIMKKAIIATDKALKEGGYKSRIVLQIHDEILLEVPVDEEKEVTQLLKKAMKSVADFDVPLEVGLERGMSWFDIK